MQFKALLAAAIFPAMAFAAAPTTTISRAPLKNDDGTCNFYFNNVLECTGDTSVVGMGKYNPDTEQCEMSNDKYKTFQADAPWFCSDSNLAFYYSDDDKGGMDFNTGGLSFNNGQGDWWVPNFGFKPTSIKARGKLDAKQQS
ncbi:hypothetical protein NUU61_006035 [Penicillium alfredii]|uniref:Uncharacterized protein n=1 Tax=Penicillium alfredii TaxID=1506179 RepID=A0A9W9F0A9_9EURO|nr:uncharacterized protein NUU61_006035 [Penicillium alfredii]KAJ5091165.1 hypothetical protein NUU61_006035 [Penicillium alfredii]